MGCPARLALLLLAAGLSLHSAHSDFTSSLSPSERNTITSESTQTTVPVTPAASTIADKLQSASAATATTSRDKVTSGPAEQGNTIISVGTTKELSAAKKHLASHTERADVSATSPSPSSTTGSESTATEHISRTSVAILTNTAVPDTATPSTTAPDTATPSTTAPDTATPATTFSHLTNTSPSSSLAGSSTQTTITNQNTIQLPNASTAAPATEDAPTKKTPTESFSSGPAIRQTSQVTLATKSVAEATSPESTTFSTGVTMEEVQRALSSGSIAAITVTVIVVVLLVFGVAAYLKIRHSSYGRLLDDHDYGSWGNYNNPLYDDS
ncbi:prostate androgen-regulated mucin-like protein 1 isoform X3 [Chelonia mydas]|uniref:prostate androgen-regulated mucin-like protein 1 isoform X3 n=1 Tax=Chelonia mydas TaxID=8469 RepID=UPI0018A1E57E|nr:prostate androgen-regulated mucin-like protein 1 isoform X3 [Chelonia mydas]